MTKETKAEMETTKNQLLRELHGTLKRIKELEAHEDRLRFIAEHVFDVCWRASDNVFCVKFYPLGHYAPGFFPKGEVLVGPAAATPLEGLCAAVDKARGK